MALQGKRIVVGLGGGIAAFKVVHLVRDLMRRGAEVRVVMTEAATRFVGPITFTGLTGKPVVTDLWAEDYAGEVHVELGDWADAIVVAPASMNLTASAPIRSVTWPTSSINSSLRCQVFEYGPCL